MNVQAICTDTDKAFVEKFAAQLRKSTGRNVVVTEIQWNGRTAYQAAFETEEAGA